jgi:hypothetical protein
MALAKLLLGAFSLALLSYGLPEPLEKRSCDFQCACDKIAAAISDASEVFFPRERSILSSVILQSDGLSSFT